MNVTRNINHAVGVIRFGPFSVELQSGELRNGTTRLRLQKKSFELLLILLERPGQIVQREEICSLLWPGKEFVGLEGGLNTATRRLQAALNDSADSPTYIETIPRVGYRWIGAVPEPTESDSIPADPEPISAKGTGSRRASRWIWPAIGLMAAGLGAALLLSSRDKQPEFQQVTFQRGSIDSARFNADGKSVSYSACWNNSLCQVYRSQTGVTEPQPLGFAGSTLAAVLPHGQLAVLSGGKLLITSPGGASKQVAEYVTVADWSRKSGEMAALRDFGGETLVEYPLGVTIYRSSRPLSHLVNAGGGSVAAIFSTGNTYTPGQSVHITVVVSDPAAKVYGFQLSARPVTNLSNGQAGDFPGGPGLTIVCDSGATKPAGGSCARNFPVQFIEHNVPITSGRWEFDWLAPTTNIGDVMIYVAGNGANGDGDRFGDHIYNASYRLTPIAEVPQPSISSGGVVTATAYGGAAQAASGSWIEIYGKDLTGSLREWSGSDFQGAAAPTRLDDVSVDINGKPAFVQFVSPGQINVQVPDDQATGSVDVIVRRAGKASVPAKIVKISEAPALLAPAAFRTGGLQFVAAIFANTNPPVFAFGPLAGVRTRLAAPGDVLLFYGVGFGAVTPLAGSGAIPLAGSLVSNLNRTVKPVVFRIGSEDAAVSYAGLTPGFVGLYQFNVAIPSVAPGVYPLMVLLDGRPIDPSLNIEIGRP